MTIIPATNAHLDEIWEIFREVIASGDTYVFDPDLSREEALRYWLSADHHTFVVTDNDHVYGTYILRKNHPGRVLTSQMRVTWCPPRLAARDLAL
jgi:L-amino acid N-acyltransferase YncA